MGDQGCPLCVLERDNGKMRGQTVMAILDVGEGARTGKERGAGAALDNFSGRGKGLEGRINSHNGSNSRGP